MRIFVTVLLLTVLDKTRDVCSWAMTKNFWSWISSPETQKNQLICLYLHLIECLPVIVDLNEKIQKQQNNITSTWPIKDILNKLKAVLANSMAQKRLENKKCLFLGHDLKFLALNFVPGNLEESSSSFCICTCTSMNVSRNSWSKWENTMPVE